MTREQCELALTGMNLSADDFRGDAVQVVHQDGTSLLFLNALCWSAGKHLMVATEHNGYHVFHAEDLATYRYFRPKKIPTYGGRTCGQTA